MIDLSTEFHMITCNNSLVIPQKPEAEEVPYFPAHKTHFSPEKCDLNSTCVLCAEGKYYFQTYKYP